MPLWIVTYQSLALKLDHKPFEFKVYVIHLYIPKQNTVFSTQKESIKCQLNEYLNIESI